MNRVKKLLILLLSISIIMTISCGTFAASKGLIVFSVCWTEDPFWVASTDAARAVVEASGFDYKVLNANNDNMTQVNQISDTIALKPAGVLLGAVDSRGIVSAVKELQDAGIPIGVIIRNIPNAGKIDVTVDPNIFGVGQKAAVNTLNLLFSKYGAYEGKVLEIEGALIDNFSVDSHAGFMSIMEKYPDVTIVSKEATDWSFEKAANIAEDWLTVNPDTDLIYSHSDWLTQAIPPVLERLGYAPAGEENHVFVVSSGAMPFGLPHIRTGYIDMTTEIPTLKVSKLAAYWLCQIAQGNKVPDEVNLFEPGLSVKMTDKKVKVEEKSWGTHISVPPAVVTQKNVDDPNLWGNIYK
ncbi:MAG: sugar ABC transporter substrate-binding protein [Atribacterota bacterium]